MPQNVQDTLSFLGLIVLVLVSGHFFIKWTNALARWWKNRKNLKLGLREIEIRSQMRR